MMLFGVIFVVHLQANQKDSGLDIVMNIIDYDNVLIMQTPLKDRIIARVSARKMNEIILSSIEATHIAKDGFLSISDIEVLHEYIAYYYKSEWKRLYGISTIGQDMGFSKIQNDGAKIELFGKNALDEVFASIYNLGCYEKFQNNKQKSFFIVARYLNVLLKEKLRNKSI